MECYLVQHGEAKPEQEDPARPLTDRGRREVERVARAARRSGVGVAEILHSGKLRAQQTAELLAAALSPVGGVRAVAGLAPTDDPAAARAVLDQAAAPAMRESPRATGCRRSTSSTRWVPCGGAGRAGSRSCCATATSTR